MSRFNNVLFDLDGTLIDPGQGIAGTIQFVLDDLGVVAPFDGALRTRATWRWLPFLERCRLTGSPGVGHEIAFEGCPMPVLRAWYT